MSTDYELLQLLLKLTQIQNLDYIPDFKTQCLIYVDGREGGLINRDFGNINYKLDRTINAQATS